MVGEVVEGPQPLRRCLFGARSAGNQVLNCGDLNGNPFGLRARPRVQHQPAPTPPMASVAARAPPTTRVAEARSTRAGSPMRPRPLSPRPAKAPLPVSCRGSSPRRTPGAGAGGAGPVAPPLLRRSHSAAATPTTRMDTPPPPPPPGRPATAAAVPATPLEGVRAAAAEQQRVQALLLSLGGAQALTALEACWQQQTTHQGAQGPLLITPAREAAAAPAAAPARGRAAAESRQDSARQDSPGRGRAASQRSANPNQRSPHPNQRPPHPNQRPPLHAAKGGQVKGPGEAKEHGARGAEVQGPGEAKGGVSQAELKGPISPPYLGQLKPRGAGQRRG
eukprot:scaffold89447_cov59-Phaeocystis_antarctica.AAC.1